MTKKYVLKSPAATTGHLPLFLLVFASYSLEHGNISTIIIVNLIQSHKAITFPHDMRDFYS